MNLNKVTRIAGLLLLAGPAFAANPTQIDLDRAVVRAQRKAIVGRAMSLDDASASKFWSLYDDYMEAKTSVDAQLLELVREYAKNYQSMTDDKAVELTNTMLQVQDAKNKVRADYVKKFSKALPGRLVARFFQTDNKLDAFLNAMLANEIPLVPTTDLQALNGQSAPSILTK